MIKILGRTKSSVVYEHGNIIIWSDIYDFGKNELYMTSPIFISSNDAAYALDYFLQDNTVTYSHKYPMMKIYGNDYNELQKHIPNNKIMFVLNEYFKEPECMFIIGNIAAEEKVILTLIGNFKITNFPLFVKTNV